MSGLCNQDKNILGYIENNIGIKVNDKDILQDQLRKIQLQGLSH